MTVEIIPLARYSSNIHQTFNRAFSWDERLHDTLISQTPWRPNVSLIMKERVSEAAEHSQAAASIKASAVAPKSKTKPTQGDDEILLIRIINSNFPNY